MMLPSWTRKSRPPAPAVEVEDALVETEARLRAAIGAAPGRQELE